MRFCLYVSVSLQKFYDFTNNAVKQNALMHTVESTKSNWEAHKFYSITQQQKNSLGNKNKRLLHIHLGECQLCIAILIFISGNDFGVSRMLCRLANQLRYHIRRLTALTSDHFFQSPVDGDIPYTTHTHAVSIQQL